MTIASHTGRAAATAWSSPAAISDGAIHVWTVPAPSAALLAVCSEHLTPEESDRAGRFVFERDQRMAALSRGVRRMILGAYAGVASDALRFDEGAQGKPSLRDEASGLRFNVSHAGDVLVVAVARRRDVGIDIESVTPDRDISGIARHSFSVREQSALAALPESVRVAGFYRCWTQKEAFIKLIGAGMQFALDTFDVEVNPTRSPALLGIRVAAPVALPCWMTPVPAPRGYTAVLATRGAPSDLRFFQLS